MEEFLTQPGDTVKLSLSMSGWMAERWQSGQCFSIMPSEHCPLKHMQTTLWLHAMSCPVLLHHCWATVGPSKLMQAFIRLQGSSQPPPPGYSNSVTLDKANNSPCLGHFCRVWLRYWAKHDKEMPRLDGWNWVLNTYIVVISQLLCMLLKGWCCSRKTGNEGLTGAPGKKELPSTQDSPPGDVSTARKSQANSWRVAAKQRWPNCQQHNVNSYQPLDTRGLLSASTLPMADFSWSETNLAQMINLITCRQARSLVEDYWLVRTLLNLCQQLPCLPRRDAIKLCHKDLLLPEAI